MNNFIKDKRETLIYGDHLLSCSLCFYFTGNTMQKTGDNHSHYLRSFISYNYLLFAAVVVFFAAVVVVVVAAVDAVVALYLNVTSFHRS